MSYFLTLAKYYKQVGYWGGPSLIALILYWPGLLAWFQKDDFAWLGLRELVHSPRELVWALFAPLSQGTIRTLSERVFFMSFSGLFGLHALPYRIWIFLTGFVTLVVLCAVCAKLTRSRAAGFWAAVLWIVNSENAYVFSWTAIYYELLCALFLLSALWLLIRYAETGERRFFIAQWAVYLAGFLVLELNVVYPALALMYALCFAPGIIRKTIPMFVPAGLYTVLHMLTAPLLTSGPYKMSWDLSVVPTFWTYWKLALGPNRLIYAGIHPSLFRSSLAVLLMGGLLGFLAWTIARRQWLTLFFAAWFVIVLAPVLPLRDHITDYYVTIPTVGLAMWGSWAVVTGWRAGPLGRATAVALMGVYLAVNIPIARIASQAFNNNSHRIRAMLYGVVALSAQQPQKIILLTGINRDLFWDAIWSRPFRLFGRNEIFLIKEECTDIVAALPPELVPTFFVTRANARIALDGGRAALYDVSGEQVRAISSEYLKNTASSSAIAGPRSLKKPVSASSPLPAVAAP